MIHYITNMGIGDPWVGNELRVVEQAGIPFILHAMRKPEGEYFVSPWAERLNRTTRLVYPISPFGIMLSVVAAPFLFRGRFLNALANAFFGKRENVRGRIAGIAHLIVACHWARGLRREQVSLIHSQWIHSCGTIGMYGAWLLGVPFSFTGHAVDLFKYRVALEDKIRRADFIICISTFHREFFKQNSARDEQLHIAYCGIDPRLFSPRPQHSKRQGPFRILSSGRLVEKKGFEYLIDTCKLLADRGEEFECVIAGSGPLERDLRARIDAVGLSDRVKMTGQPLKQEKIPEFMHSGDIYCLPCVWAKDNDVDGLPQMLMEAMACGLPVISTRLVGIPDLVIDGKTGLLVEPRNAEQLAEAILSLKNEPDRAAQLAEAGRGWVVEKFNLSNCLEPLLNQFRSKLRQNTKASTAAEGVVATHKAASR